MANKNSVLLFGDYGTEVIRLSQLYDPDKCLYQPVSRGDTIDPNKTYYTPELRNKTVFFDVADLSARAGGEFAYDGEYYEKDPTKDESQEGKYVPATQTIVVVDEVNEFGQYTLLIVDWVENADITSKSKDKILVGKLEGLTEEEQEQVKQTYVPSYRSHLKPINFTGGVDQATRAVDYNNDQMMLYIEDVTNPNHSSERYQRLVPDRKLMMYGPRSLSYVLKQTIGDEEVIISTSSYRGSRGDHAEMGYFVTACGRNLIVKDLETFEALAGRHIEYYDADGIRQQKTVIIDKDENDQLTETTQELYEELLACYEDGRYITEVSNSDDLIVQVQIPVPCYLRNSIAPLTAGQLVTMEIYEVDEASASKRLITSVLLHTRSGSSLEIANDNRTLVGFDVAINNNTADFIDVVAGSTSVDLVPFLKFDDGSTQRVDISRFKWEDVSVEGTEMAPGLFAYGLNKIKSGSSTFAEFDVLFKYFPAVAAGVSTTSDINTRYEPTEDTVPSPLKQYFIMNEDSNANRVPWKLAGNDGYFEEGAAFEQGVTYYERKMTLAWNGTVTRPTNTCLVSRKRIRIVEGMSGAASSLRHISTIPIWDNETCSYDFKFLVYDKSYKSPKLIGREETDDGYILGSERLPYGENLADKPETTSEVFTAEISYKPNRSTPAWLATRTVMVEVRELTKYSDYESSNRSGNERFLIGGRGTSGDGGGWTDAVIPYGRANASLRVKNTRGDFAFGNRPRLECWTEDVNGETVAKFQIPVDQTYGFPNMSDAPDNNQFNWFFWQFYRAALDADDAWESDVMPNCFCLRAAEPGEVTRMVDGVATKVTVPADEIRSKYIPMTSNSNNQIMPYAAAFECEGIRIPTKYDSETGDIYLPTIAIVEFAYSNNGTVKSLIGVPVEIVRIDHNPAEETL